MESAKPEAQQAEAAVVDIVPAKAKDPIGNQLVHQPTTPADLLRMAVEGGADVDKLEKLMELKMRWDANEAKKDYLAAMAKFKENPPVVMKDKENKQYGSRYASLESWLSAVLPELSKVGLTPRWDQSQPDGKIAVTCYLTHEGGHSESSKMEGPPDRSGAKNELQQIKSTCTYLRIGTLESILGMSSGLFSINDDGTASNTHPPEPLARAKQAQASRQTPKQETTQQAATEPPKKPQSKEGQEKREFAHICNVQAHVFGLIAENGTLEPKEYQGLLAQAMQLVGAETIPEASQWATQNVTNMVRDEAGVRFIT